MIDDTSPVLAWTVVYVADVRTALSLYTEAFGLDVAYADDGGDYAEFATGSTALALCERALAANSTGLSLDGIGPPRGNITLVVPDVPAAYERAIAAGAEAVAPPVTKPWGQVSSYVADADGNLVELATRVQTG